MALLRRSFREYHEVERQRRRDAWELEILRAQAAGSDEVATPVIVRHKVEKRAFQRAKAAARQQATVGRIQAGGSLAADVLADKDAGEATAGTGPLDAAKWEDGDAGASASRRATAASSSGVDALPQNAQPHCKTGPPRPTSASHVVPRPPSMAREMAPTQPASVPHVALRPHERARALDLTPSAPAPPVDPRPFASALAPFLTPLAAAPPGVLRPTASAPALAPTPPAAVSPAVASPRVPKLRSAPPKLAPKPAAPVPPVISRPLLPTPPAGPPPLVPTPPLIPSPLPGPPLRVPTQPVQPLPPAPMNKARPLSSPSAPPAATRRRLAVTPLEAPHPLPPWRTVPLREATAPSPTPRLRILVVSHGQSRRNVPFVVAKTFSVVAFADPHSGVLRRHDGRCSTLSRWSPECPMQLGHAEV